MLTGGHPQTPGLAALFFSALKRRSKQGPTLENALDAGVDADDAFGAVDGEEHTVFGDGGADDGLDDAGHPVFAGDDGAVAEDAAGVSDDGADGGEEGRPGGHPP